MVLILFLNLIAVGDLSSIHEIFDKGSLNSALICSGVFIVYTVVIKLFESIKQKDKNKPIIEMGNTIRQMSVNLEALNQTLINFIEDITKNDKERCRVTIDLATRHFYHAILVDCRKIINNNNIHKNRSVVESNVFNIVSNNYFKVQAGLSLYSFGGKNVAQSCKQGWITDTVENVIKIIYSDDDKETRINNINNYLDIKTSGYSQYIYNKTFNS